MRKDEIYVLNITWPNGTTSRFKGRYLGISRIEGGDWHQFMRLDGWGVYCIGVGEEEGQVEGYV